MKTEKNSTVRSEKYYRVFSELNTPGKCDNTFAFPGVNMRFLTSHLGLIAL